MKGVQIIHTFWLTAEKLAKLTKFCLKIRFTLAESLRQMVGDCYKWRRNVINTAVSYTYIPLKDFSYYRLKSEISL